MAVHDIPIKNIPSALAYPDKESKGASLLAVYGMFVAVALYTETPPHLQPPPEEPKNLSLPLPPPRWQAEVNHNLFLSAISMQTAIKNFLIENNNEEAEALHSQRMSMPLYMDGLNRRVGNSIANYR